MKYAVTIVGTELRGKSKRQQHTVYIVLVALGEFAWVVLRRYSQFHALNEKLRKKYGGEMKEISSQFPGKLLRNNMSPVEVDRRRTMLQKFVTLVLARDKLHCCWELQKFLETGRESVESYDQVIHSFSEAIEQQEDDHSRRGGRAKTLIESVQIAEHAGEGVTNVLVNQQEVWHSGYLFKLHGTSWVRRHFVLRATGLYKYAAHGDAHPKGRYTVAGAVVKTVEDRGKANRAFQFSISVGDKPRYFAADSVLSMDAWIDALTQVANYSQHPGVDKGVRGKVRSQSKLESASPKRLHERSTSSSVIFSDLRLADVLASKEAASYRFVDPKLPGAKFMMDFVDRLVCVFDDHSFSFGELKEAAREVTEVSKEREGLEPLVTYELNLSVLATYNVRMPVKRCMLLHGLVRSLPVENYKALETLIHFLRSASIRLVLVEESITHSAVLDRLSRLFARPVVFCTDIALASPQYEANAAVAVVRTFIENYDDIFKSHPDDLPPAVVPPKPPIIIEETSSDIDDDLVLVPEESQHVASGGSTAEGDLEPPSVNEESEGSYPDSDSSYLEPPAYAAPTVEQAEELNNPRDTLRAWQDYKTKRASATLEPNFQSKVKHMDSEMASAASSGDEDYAITPRQKHGSQAVHSGNEDASCSEDFVDRSGLH